MDANAITSDPAQRERITRVFSAQRRRALAWRVSSAAQRTDRLRALVAAVERQQDAICAACAADFGKPATEVLLAEVLPFLAEARHAMRDTARWMRARRVATPLSLAGTRSEVRPEPKGVALVISPWNYPFNLAMTPLVSALAAGNTVMLKPSELTPSVSALLARLLGEVFAEDEVAVFEGGREVAEALLEQPFDHVFFTGSPQVGRIVMAAAARHLASVTLELGGKSPVIVDRGADIGKAAREIAWGKFANAGQTCIAPDHVYVHAEVLEAFIGETEKHVRRAFGDSPAARAASPDFCRIVSERHFARIAGLIDEAVAGGARVRFGNERDAGARYIAPTLLTDPPAGSALMREEIFGPVLPVLAWTDLDAVLADINARPKPLALYLFARDQSLVERVLARTSAGGGCVNHVLLHYLNGNLPFGGVNESGIGKSHGEAGFLEFSNQRAVLTARRSIAHWLYPPYTARVRQLTRFVLRWLR